MEDSINSDSGGNNAITEAVVENVCDEDDDITMAASASSYRQRLLQAQIMDFEISVSDEIEAEEYRGYDGSDRDNSATLLEIDAAIHKLLKWHSDRLVSVMESKQHGEELFPETDDDIDPRRIEQLSIMELIQIQGERFDKDVETLREKLSAIKPSADILQSLLQSPRWNHDALPSVFKTLKVNTGKFLPSSDLLDKDAEDDKIRQIVAEVREQCAEESYQLEDTVIQESIELQSSVFSLQDKLRNYADEVNAILMSSSTTDDRS